MAKNAKNKTKEEVIEINRELKTVGALIKALEKFGKRQAIKVSEDEDGLSFRAIEGVYEDESAKGIAIYLK